MPRPFAAALVLLALLVTASASIVIAVAGIADQPPRSAAVSATASTRSPPGWTISTSRSGRARAWSTGSAISGRSSAPGLSSYVGTVFSSTASFFAGTFIAVFMLYFILADWDRLRAWVAAHLGVDAGVGEEIVDDTTWSMRQYFVALTVSSVIVAIMVGSTVWILGLPLVAAITLVTFFTSYVPYLGALFSGAFAVLIALGSGGVTDAAVVLVVILVAQNIVQAIVQTKMSEGRLSLHPIVIFGSTIAGGATLGLLGAALSTPAVAVAVRVVRRLTTEREAADGSAEG